MALWNHSFIHSFIQQVCTRYLPCAKRWIRITMREGEGGFWPQGRESNFGIFVGLNHHKSQKQPKTKIGQGFITQNVCSVGTGGERVPGGPLGWDGIKCGGEGVPGSSQPECRLSWGCQVGKQAFPGGAAWPGALGDASRGWKLRRNPVSLIRLSTRRRCGLSMRKTRRRVRNSAAENPLLSGGSPVMFHMWGSHTRFSLNNIHWNSLGRLKMLQKEVPTYPPVFLT